MSECWLGERQEINEVNGRMNRQRRKQHAGKSRYRVDEKRGGPVIDPLFSLCIPLPETTISHCQWVRPSLSVIFLVAEMHILYV